MSKGEQIRDFTPVEEVSKKLFNLSMNLSELPSGGIITNVGTGKPMSLWNLLMNNGSKANQKEKLIPGALPYREQEVMRYVPLI